MWWSRCLLRTVESLTYAARPGLRESPATQGAGDGGLGKDAINLTHIVGLAFEHLEVLGNGTGIAAGDRPGEGRITLAQGVVQRCRQQRAQEPVEFPEGAIPLTDGAPGKADEVADLVLFLASDASSHISGTEIWIDGASSLLQG